MELRTLAAIVAISGLLAPASGCGGGGSTNATGPGNTPDGSTGHSPDSSAPGSDSSAPMPDGSSGSPEASPGTDGAMPEGSTGNDGSTASHAIKTVFIIMMENENWSNITADSSATYINGTLVPNSGIALQYYTPPGNHPSEPNYIWLEAGSNLDITTDDEPATNHQSTTSHLVTQLSTAGIPWKAYVENIPMPGTCPLVDTGLFVTRHTPMLFFDDITNTNSPNAPTCIADIVPYTNLATDLASNTVARYNFITPNLCDDMHSDILVGVDCANIDEIENGDEWLSTNVPPILASSAYQDGGLLLILWDEGTLSLSDGPIGAIVMSPFLKSKGYSNSIHYTHSSTLKTVEEIFSVPLLRDAATATTTDLSDFFTAFP
jgi:hypothetical protein